MTESGNLAKKVEVRFKKYFEEAATTQLAERSHDPRRMYFLRPSSFPYCGLRKLLDFQEWVAQDGTQHMGSEMLFYVTVGTAFHHVFQEVLGKHGQIYGNWKCPKCKNVKHFTTYSRCKKCRIPRRYEELEVKFKKTLVGHIDGVYFDEASKTWWVIDYKSTSGYQVYLHKKGPAKLPYRDNVHQIRAYVPLFEKQYGVSVSGYMLVYLPRDNPFKAQIVCIKHMDTEDKLKQLKLLKRTVKTHRIVLTTRPTSSQLSSIYARKLCSSREDYSVNFESNFDPCPYAGKCFKPDKMIGYMKNTMSKVDVWPMIEQAPKKIREELEL